MKNWREIISRVQEHWACCSPVIINFLVKCAVLEIRFGYIIKIAEHYREMEQLNKLYPLGVTRSASHSPQFKEPVVY